MALAIVASCLMCIPASASAAQVSGRVFNDFNTNGLFDTDQNAGAVDEPVSGLTIQAFTGTDTLVGTATSNAEGEYTLNLPSTRVRLELNVVRPWWPTRQLSGLRSDVQFVDASSAQTGVDFGVHRISEFSVDNPTLFWPLQWAGPATADSENAHEDAVRGLPYFRGQSSPITARWENQPAADRKHPATFGEIGTVFGVGINQRNGDLYAGAYYKRFAGLKDRRTGAIYRITRSGDVSLFHNLPAGTDGHPNSTNINDWVLCPDNCDTSWDLVGKRGLGSVVVDPGNENVYAVNLFNNTLYRLPLGGGEHAIPIRNPGCEGGVWRAFAAGFNRADGKLYVGGVCDAETDQNPEHLFAVVYRVDHPTSAPSFTEVLRIPLNYPRAPRTGTLLQFCNTGPQLTGTPAYTPGFCQWRPWPTTASTGGFAPANAARGAPALELSNDNYPQLTAITFAADGSMILGFRDLIGDMAGACIPGELSTGNACTATTGMGPMVHGDLLTAAPNAAGAFTLESNGTVGSKVSLGQTFNNWGYGPIGPDPGYFYNPSPISGPGGTSCPAPQVGGCTSGAPHPYQGGVTQVPGFADVVATSIHVLDPQANGLLWKDNGTARASPARPSLPGANIRSLQNHVTPNAPNPQTPALEGFAKSNGLGDIDAFTGLAPVQIGNRLWYDEDKNGIQDADERPVTDTIVELVNCDGVVIGTTETDSVGEYVFHIDADTCYTVRVPLDQPSLHGWVVTQAFAGNHSHPFIDSNGRQENGRSVAFVTPKGTGQNNHTYDFGFHRPPPPVPEEERTPTQPSLPGPLVLVKRVASSSGGTLRFVMVVRNGGPNAIASVRVCDQLSSRLNFVSATRSGRRVTGRQVCWSFASLRSGQEQTLRLSARLRAAVPASGLTNCARATARNVRARRACATVRGARLPAFTG